MIAMLVLTAALFSPATPAQTAQVKTWTQAIAQFHPFVTARPSTAPAVVNNTALVPAQLNAESLRLDAQGLRNPDAAPGAPLIEPVKKSRPVLTIAPDVRAAPIVDALRRIHEAGQPRVALLVKPAKALVLPASLNPGLTRELRQQMAKSSANPMDPVIKALGTVVKQCDGLQMTITALSDPAVAPWMQGELLLAGTNRSTQRCPAQPIFDFTAVLTATIPEDVAVGIELTLDPNAKPLVVAQDATWQSIAEAVAKHDGPFWLAVQ